MNTSVFFDPTTDHGIQQQIPWFKILVQLQILNFLIQQQIIESNDRSLKVEFNYRFKDPITDPKFLIQQKIIVEREEERVIEEERKIEREREREKREREREREREKWEI